MACSKLKKQVCMNEKDCEWIVGKGCKKASKVQVSVADWTSGPVDVIFSKEVKKEVFRLVHPDLQCSKQFVDGTDVFIYKCIHYILRGKQTKYDVNDVRMAFKNSKFGEVSKHFNSEGEKGVSKKNSMFYFKTLSDKIHQVFGKQLTEHAIYYLAKGVEYLYAEIVELSGYQCLDEKKVRIQLHHLKNSVENDDELSELVKVFHK